jgi:CRP/FNR family transcriptional regulator, cyclic AMP receptor protein
VIDIYDFIEAAKTHDLLNTLEPPHMEKLLGLAKEVRFGPDEVVLRDGAKPGFLYFILQGKVALEILTQERSLLVQVLEAGDAMGWSSLMDGVGGGDFQARSLEPVRALAFEGPQLRAACESDPGFGFSMTKLAFGLIADCLDAARVRLIERVCR